MQEYEKMAIKVIFFEKNDVLTNSKNDASVLTIDEINIVPTFVVKRRTKKAM